VRHLGIELRSLAPAFIIACICRGLEAGPADQSDRALDRGRLDRSDNRLVAGEMEKSLGQTVVIINQLGASGSIGTRSALEATKDGCTWTPGAAQR